ncbi:MAG: DUF2807 domain-containing protein [Prevotellaceae bacterium]|jgi:hypothetical protein|nr:DUF2807 domain-containing protein [Prevotellaceae bacterium]
MKIKSLALLICTFILCTPACIAENVVKETRETGTFRKISAGGGINVYFTQNNSQSIQVEADKDYIDKIITRVEGETLVIKMDNKDCSCGARTTNVYVSVPALDEVSISGGSDFYADDLKCSNSFKLRASGGSKAKIGDLKVAENAEISALGGADANIKSLTGVKNTNVSASVGSDCDIKTLQTAECELSASGGGDVYRN